MTKLGDDKVNLEVEFSLPVEPVASLAGVVPVVRLVSKLVACLLVAIEAGDDRGQRAGMIIVSRRQAYWPWVQPGTGFQTSGHSNFHL